MSDEVEVRLCVEAGFVHTSERGFCALCDQVDDLRAQLAQREGELEALRALAKELIDVAHNGGNHWHQRTGDDSRSICPFKDRLAALSDNQEGR